MVQLRSCYFCGAVGDSLREYEVVPERLASPDGSRSAVLCSTCHEKLRRVLEPLIEATEADATTGTEHVSSSLQEVTFESDASNGSDDESVTDGENGVAEDVDTAEDGVDTTATVDESDATANVDEASEEPDDGVDSAGTTSPDDADGEPTDENLPDGYYKVLRLLQNREFPMERADLTALVTGAYDVSEPQCERILETAIDRGILVEDGSAVDLGRN